jgi:uncharacterized protein YjbI with pentapeptide repeats
MQIKGIASDTLNFILETSKSMAPEEFAGLLQERDGIITEVIILPGTESSEQNAVINLFMMPNVKAAGSIHSHPGPNHKPSQADLHLFSKTGSCHIIVGYPYDGQSWTCYDKEGNARELQVFDVKFENFEEANLDGANFKGANLEGTDFKKANLEEADLEEANLKRANLVETDLKGADLKGANLEGVNLQEANLEGADLREANLKEAYISEANLENANLEGTMFDGANLEGANLEGANLKRANLGSANLKEANLEGANLEGANLEGANLEGANLEWADLIKANLEGSNLKGVGELTIDQLSKVKTLYNAKLDNELLIPLKEKYPALFEKPEDKE